MSDTPKITEAAERVRAWCDAIEPSAERLPNEPMLGFIEDVRTLLDAVKAQTEPPAVTEEMVERAWRAGTAVYGDETAPGGRDLRAMRIALEAALAVSPKKGQDQ